MRAAFHSQSLPADAGLSEDGDPEAPFDPLDGDVANRAQGEPAQGLDAKFGAPPATRPSAKARSPIPYAQDAVRYREALNQTRPDIEAIIQKYRAAVKALGPQPGYNQYSADQSALGAQMLGEIEARYARMERDFNIRPPAQPAFMPSSLRWALADAAHRSPALASALDKLQRANGWHINWGKSGSGLFSQRSDHQVVVDPMLLLAPERFLTTFAHEITHPLLDRRADLSMPEEPYVQTFLENEARAELGAFAIAQELGLDAIGPRYSNLGDRAREIFKEYQRTKDEGTFRRDLADVIAQIHPLKYPDMTYRQYAHWQHQKANQSRGSEPAEAPLDSKGP